ADNLKFDRLAVVQAAVPIRLNRGEMDENVLSGLALDKSKAFAGIEPLHCSLFTSRFSFRKSYLMLRLPNLIERGCGCPWSAFPVRSAGTKKGRKLVEHLATASRLQRRYKSNKRRYSIAQSCQSVQHILAAHSNALMSTVRGAIRASGGSWVNDLLLVL